MNALPAVARVTKRAVPPYTQETWEQASQLCLDLGETQQLYRECLSYGIVERDSGRTWRWSHPFFVDYLANLAGGDGDE